MCIMIIILCGNSVSINVYMYNTCTSISVALIMSFEDIPITNKKINKYWPITIADLIVHYIIINFNYCIYIS